MTGAGAHLLALEEFLESGGYVLYAILATALVTWFLIGERYWYFLFVEKQTAKNVIADWETLSAASTTMLKAIRSCRISQFRQAARKHLVLIKALTNVSILFGLLGTITGMIRLFEGIALTRGGDVRMLADGVSQTIIPAMAGLVVAISGFYFSSRLKRRADREVHRMADQLSLTKR